MIGALSGVWCVHNLVTETMASIPSPDGDWMFVVERHTFLLDPPYRKFRIMVRSTGDEADGSTYLEHEYESGGIDMSRMKTYWRGDTAVADFGSIRLEQTVRRDRIWEWKSDNAPAPATKPTTNESL
jgi:hypothetical protein